jgi:glucose/arabinose dehydrogenase
MTSRIAVMVAVVASLLALPTTSSARGSSTPLSLVPITSSLAGPLAMAVRTGDPNFYVAEQGGRVVPVDPSDGTIGPAVLDITGETACCGELGLLGLTFSPAGDKMFVFLTSATGTGGDPYTDVLREYSFDGTTASSPHDLLDIPDPEPNHNGGNIAFGPDGDLYIGTGDGGGGGDHHGRIGNGQNVNVLLGKILRIAPTATGYDIPPGNPLVGRKGLDEIWDFGLRNPWRWSFDRATGDLWIGDVGQDRFEEIDFQRAGASFANFGWRRMEGDATYPPGSTLPPPPRYHHPIWVYSHAGGRCAVIGGYRYRGTAIPALRGAYLFSDNCDGKIRAFRKVRGRARRQRVLNCAGSPCTAPNISSFGEDATGELYVLTLDGRLMKIVPA